MSTRDIHDQLQDLYGIEMSAEMVSKVTDKVLPRDQGMAVKAPEPSVAVRVHGLHPLQGQGGWADIQPCSLCGAGCHTEGHKEILNITVVANESFKFWLGML